MPNLDPEIWLNLGLAGAALFIILVVVILILKNLTNSISKLCDKLDNLIKSNYDNVTALNKILINTSKDQKVLLDILNNIQDLLLDMRKRVIRIDTRVHDSMEKEEN